MSAPLPPGHTRRPAPSAQTGKQDEHRCAAVALGTHGWICGVCKQPMHTQPAPPAHLTCTCHVRSDAIGPHTRGCPNHPEAVR